LASRFSYKRRYANVFVIYEVAETDAVVGVLNGSIIGGYLSGGHLSSIKERKPSFSFLCDTFIPAELYKTAAKIKQASHNSYII
jgi:hypothetical protein